MPSGSPPVAIQTTSTAGKIDLCWTLFFGLHTLASFLRKHDEQCSVSRVAERESR